MEEDLNCSLFIAEEENYDVEAAAAVPIPKQIENLGMEVTYQDLPWNSNDNPRSLESPPAVNNMMPVRSSMRSSTYAVKQPVVVDKRPQRVRYPVMIRQVMENAHNPQGAHSLQAIRRYILELFPETKVKHKASFNRYAVLIL